MYQRAQLKEQVKQAMRSTRPRPMWVALLFTVIVAAGSWLINAVFTAISGISALSISFAGLLEAGYEVQEAIEQMIWAYGHQLALVIGSLVTYSVLTSLITALWSGLMNVGFAGYCLSMTRGEQPGVGKLFCGFPLIGKVLLTHLLVWVFTALWSMLYCVGFAVIALIGALLMEAAPAVSVILFILGWAALMVLMVRLYLRYALADYVLLDTGKYGLEAISQSKAMMKGNKGRLFMLYLSFIGWYLIQAAILWVGIFVIMVLGVVAGAAASGFSFGAAAGVLGGILAVLILMTAGSLLFGSWLQPYVTGSVAKFYDFLKGAQTPVVENGWPTLGGGNAADGGSQD